MAATTEFTATIDHVRKLFEEFDTNGDGRLSLEELQALCAAMGVFVDTDGARTILEAIDTDSDGSVSPVELHAFLNERRGEVETSSSIVLRTALLARYVAHAGASIVRRISSSKEASTIAPISAAMATTLNVHANIGGGSEPTESGLSALFEITSRLDVMEPPPEMTSGSGILYCFSVKEGVTAATVVDALNAMLSTLPEAPMPPGLERPRAIVLGDYAALILDAPMFDFGPILQATVGITNPAETFRGFRYKLEVHADQGLSAMLESDAAPARTVKATINGEVTIPQHLVQFLETTGEALSESSLHATVPAGAVLVMKVYGMLFSILRKVEIEYEFPSVATMLSKYETFIAIAARASGSESSVETYRAIRDIGRLVPKEHKESIVSGMAAQLRTTGESLSPEWHINARTALSSMTGVPGIYFWAGPMAMQIETRNCTSDWLAQVAEAAWPTPSE